MGHMQRILESYRDEILVANPRNFAMLAEGPLEQQLIDQAGVDRTVFSVTSLAEAEQADLAYWRQRTPDERLEALELSRQIELLRREKTTGLSAEERRELDHFENLELLMNLAKARARQLLAHGD